MDQCGLLTVPGAKQSNHGSVQTEYESKRQEADTDQKLLKLEPYLVKYNEVSKTIDLESHLEI